MRAMTNHLYYPTSSGLKMNNLLQYTALVVFVTHLDQNSNNSSSKIDNF